jgi:hypothetical protein
LLRAWNMTGVKIQKSRSAQCTGDPPGTKAFLLLNSILLHPARKTPNYASELYQVMMLRLSKVGRTSCVQTVGHGRVHYLLFQNTIFLCMQNIWKKLESLFQTTWMQFCRLCPQLSPECPFYTLNDTFIIDLSSTESSFF